MAKAKPFAGKESKSEEMKEGKSGKKSSGKNPFASKKSKGGY